jgi:hypothetical protein
VAFPAWRCGIDVCAGFVTTTYVLVETITLVQCLGIREYLGLDPHFEEQGFTPYAAAG